MGQIIIIRHFLFIFVKIFVRFLSYTHRYTVLYYKKLRQSCVEKYRHLLQRWGFYAAVFYVRESKDIF